MPLVRSASDSSRMPTGLVGSWVFVSGCFSGGCTSVGWPSVSWAGSRISIVIRSCGEMLESRSVDGGREGSSVNEYQSSSVGLSSVRPVKSRLPASPCGSPAALEPVSE